MSKYVDEMYLSATGKTKSKFEKDNVNVDPVVLKSIVELIEGNLIINEVVRKNHPNWKVSFHGSNLIFVMDGDTKNSAALAILSFKNLLEVMSYRRNILEQDDMGSYYNDEFERQLREIEVNLNNAYKKWVEDSGAKPII